MKDIGKMYVAGMALALVVLGSVVLLANQLFGVGLGAALLTACPAVAVLLFWQFVRERLLKPMEHIQKEAELLSQNSEDAIAPETIEDVVTILVQVKERLSEVESKSENLITSEKFLMYRAGRYESILQSLPDGILILDEDHRAAFLNQHVETMFGVSHHDLI